MNGRRDTSLAIALLLILGGLALLFFTLTQGADPYGPF